MRRNALAIAFSLLGMVPVVHSQDATDLDDVIVTATRTETSVSTSALPAQVITRADIQRSQARDLPGLLRGRAGLDITNQGGPGKISSVFMRGTSSSQTLVLIDGVKIGSPTDGAAALQSLPIDQVDRIEIVRGARSSLYGSEAIGGVIQIFTRRDKGPLSPRFRVGIGSHQRQETSLGIGGAIGRGWFGTDVAWDRTDGINACRGRAPDPSDPTDFGAGCLVDQPDRDGFRNASLSLRGGIQASDTIAVEGSALRSDGRNDYDGGIYGGNRSDTVQQVIGAKLLWTPNSDTRITTQAGRAYDKSSNAFIDPATGQRSFVSAFDSRRDTASVQGDFNVGEHHLLTTGFDWQNDIIAGTTAYDITSRRNSAAFAEYQGRVGVHQLQASARLDDNAQFGDHTTGSLGWTWGFSEGWMLRASYGTGFKAPTFNDLYFPFYGNPELKPEKSRNANLGATFERTAWKMALDAYQIQVEDLIAYDFALFRPGNVDQARIRGIELTATTSLAGWDLSTQLSHTDPRNRSVGLNHNNWLARRARNSGRVDVDRHLGAFNFGVSVFGSSHRYDDPANLQRLGGYSTVDLRGEYAISSDWLLQGRVSNVFDRTYETARWYNQPGREYGLSLRYSPQGR